MKYDIDMDSGFLVVGYNLSYNCDWLQPPVNLRRISCFR